VTTTHLPLLQPLQSVRAEVVEVAYDEAGPADGDPVLLLHGFPCDIHSYVDVVPLLADAGLRVIVPYLRGARADLVLGPVQPTLRPAGGAGRRRHRVHGRPWPTQGSPGRLRLGRPRRMRRRGVVAAAHGSHNLSQEAPHGFASAILELTDLRSSSGRA
jgi:hypothetical protein